jgi:phage terminase large subunit-like protein
VPSPRIDADTKDWIIDASDERAAAAGMVMDLEAAAHHIDWVQNNCCFYEGETAGKPFELLAWEKAFYVRLFGWRMWDPEWKQWVRRFRKGALWAAKKNGKSPFLAATALTLLINDGEKGNKIYMAAMNGEQARIAQRHAFEMVRMSPALSDQCKLYANTLEIVHQASRSRQMVLAGNDSRGQKSKEGLNGSVLFDEMHVVDRGLEERVSRAGISRKQPLQLSMSTAGDDPSSIGKERYDHGKQVARGDRDDLRFLHVDYSVPEGTKESDIIANPTKYGQMANPSWGQIIKPSEFEADLKGSLGKPREMARFMQYRGNLWIGSTNRWLDLQAWEACGTDDIGIPQLAGRECYMGLDMARRLDMAAAVFAFPWPELGEDGVFFWPMLWLPEGTAKSRDILYPLMTWARDGFLKLTPGDVLDYDRIKKDIREFVKSVNLLEIFYDIHYANEITQQLVEGESNGDGGMFVDGFNCPRTEFKQDIRYLTTPCVELERRIKYNKVRHPRNPVLDWQVGHVEVKTDPNQNIRPVKPDPNSGKSIDGILGMVMSLHGVYAAQTLTPRMFG